MSSISFEHTCPRCEGHQMGHHIDPNTDQEFDLCLQCGLPADQPLTPLDNLIKNLWEYKEKTGRLSTEDIRAFQSELTPPPETEEIQWEDLDEFAARQERSARIREAMGDPVPTTLDYPTSSLPSEPFGTPGTEPLNAPDLATYEPDGASINPPTIESTDSFAGQESPMGPQDPDAESDPYGGSYGFLNPQFRPSYPFLAPGTRPPIGFLEPLFKPGPNFEPDFGPDSGPGFGPGFGPDFGPMH